MIDRRLLERIGRVRYAWFNAFIGFDAWLKRARAPLRIRVLVAQIATLRR